MVLEPFLWAWIIYVFALICLLMTALWARTPGYIATWILVLVGLFYEVYGFACRIIISGRPPVTDLYETVIWVSFIGMVFAIILEAVYRKRYFFYAGLPAAILTLIVADSDSTILDASINPLTAVLRNNMWLTIHVLTIVSSYAAFALTAALGHIALVMSFWGKRYAAAQNEVQFFIYRAMQIGIMLLATGTILGGVWANYSWGRFWGWDPKETWALITLLCYIALLHGRLAGWWRGFGLAVGSVVCFLSVMMSWYGVNFILGQNGKSLHSYGLSTGGLSYATGFAALEVRLRRRRSVVEQKSRQRENLLANRAGERSGGTAGLMAIPFRLLVPLVPAIVPVPPRDGCASRNRKSCKAESRSIQCNSTTREKSASNIPRKSASPLSRAFPSRTAPSSVRSVASRAWSARIPPGSRSATASTSVPNIAATEA